MGRNCSQDSYFREQPRHLSPRSQVIRKRALNKTDRVTRTRIPLRIILAFNERSIECFHPSLPFLPITDCFAPPRANFQHRARAFLPFRSTEHSFHRWFHRARGRGRRLERRMSTRERDSIVESVESVEERGRACTLIDAKGCAIACTRPRKRARACVCVCVKLVTGG